MPVEILPQTEMVLPTQIPTAPVETLPQTDLVPPIEVPATPVEPIEGPTAPSSEFLYDRVHVLTDIQEEDVEMSVKLVDKPIPPSFPTLPEPIPLRKSTKPPRDPSINTVLLGAATPVAPVGGMRTVEEGTRSQPRQTEQEFSSIWRDGQRGWRKFLLDCSRYKKEK